MKRILTSVFCLLLLLSANAYAGKYCAGTYKKHRAATRTTVADPAENNYDVKYLKFNLHLADTTTYISGNVSTTAEVTAASMSTYVFELDTTMIIDSAKVGGVLLPSTEAGTVRTIVLPSALSAGAFFTAQIIYHGTPPPSSGYACPGLSSHHRGRRANRGNRRAS